MEKKYIEELEIGKIYKTRHYNKWLIYLGKYITYSPQYGIKEYYAFMKDLKDNKHKFILYETIKKTFHLVKKDQFIMVDDLLDILRKLSPELNMTDRVVGFGFKGTKYKSMVDLLKSYSTGLYRDISCNNVFYKDNKKWKSTYMILANFNGFPKNYKKQKPRRIRLKDYTIRSTIPSSTYSVGRNQKIKIKPKNPITTLRQIRTITLKTLPAPYYTDIKSVMVKFSNGVLWEFSMKYNIYKGLLKINEDTRL